jgi:hypothetical protein
MHKTEAGEKAKALKREARELARDATATKRAAKTLPEAHEKARELQEEADMARSEAVALRPVARLEDTNVWVMEKVKTTKKGSRSYRYWMANWREGGKVRNVHLGSCGKMDEETARQKARELKAVALCMSERVIQRVSELER